MRPPVAVTVLAALAVAANVALAQPPGTPPTAQPRHDGAPRIEMRAARLVAPVTVDGALTEAVWSEAPALDAFTQTEPVEGVPPSQRTEVRVAFDEDALYVGARMWDTRPDSIRALLTRRDVMVVADRIGVYLDPYLDRRSGYYFIVNAAGVQFDGTLLNDSWDDDSWDGVWSSAARVDDQGWTCEMRIPYSQLRFNRAEHQRWGINFKRVIARHDEQDYVAWTPRGASGFVSRFPHLVGLGGVSPRRAVEAVPYVTTRGEYLSHRDGDPFHDDADYVPEGGADLRTALGSRLTLNATFNPDFGQVEVDPAVVNLSDVESYFQEKRPFFVEGMQNFRFGNEGASDYWSFNWPEPTFFYSRRIGRAPQVVDDASFTDVPVGTRILGAAKVTGKLTPTTNLGTLHALTGREIARYADSSSRWESEAEPPTYYGATRTLREFREGRKGLGFMGTTVVRGFGDGGLDDALNRTSSVLGTDGWWFLDREKKYVISGYTAVSHVTGTRARIEALQRSSRRYLQRPDRKHHRLDPDATSLTGFASRYWLNKQSGNVLLNAAVGAIDPRFENNDIGFLSRAGLVNAHLGGGYQWTRNNPWRRYANVLGSLFASSDFDGNMTAKAAWASSQVQWANRWYSRLNVDWFLEAVGDRRTRGGPLMREPAGGELYFAGSTDERRPLSYELEVNAMRLTVGTSQLNVNPTATWKPVSNVSVELGPGFERVIEDAQWVTRVDEPTATATYGQRHVFASLDQRTYYASARLNWTFNPRLSLQLYAQPLVSTGRYSGYKELATTGSYDFTEYGGGAAPSGGSVAVTPATGAPFAFRDPDFDIKSLRGNAVLRWEYLPGSALFVVWTQQRVDDQLLPAFGVRRSFDRLLDAKADNIFLIKATRYFTL